MSDVNLVVDWVLVILDKLLGYIEYSQSKKYAKNEYPTNASDVRQAFSLSSITGTADRSLLPKIISGSP